MSLLTNRSAYSSVRSLFVWDARAFWILVSLEESGYNLFLSHIFHLFWGKYGLIFLLWITLCIYVFMCILDLEVLFRILIGFMYYLFLFVLLPFTVFILECAEIVPVDTLYLFFTALVEYCRVGWHFLWIAFVWPFIEAIGTLSLIVLFLYCFLRFTGWGRKIVRWLDSF